MEVKYILNQLQKDYLWYRLEMYGQWNCTDKEYEFSYWKDKEWYIVKNEEPNTDFCYSLFIDDFEYDRLTLAMFNGVKNGFSNK